ncbi:MAG: hypothetical protein AAGI30_11355 [Planctomycetota bacterium]
MMTRASAVTFATGLAVSVAPLGAASDPELIATGETLEFFSPTGDRQFGEPYEYIVPDLLGSVFTFTVYGGDGGGALTGDNNPCFNAGGQGATATIDAVVGESEFQLTPGRAIRFIVGAQGGPGSRPQANRTVGGGGGGGSAVAYNATNGGPMTPSGQNGWELLAVAGGGGGAASQSTFGVCSAADQEGKDAETGTAGGDAVQGAGGNDNGEAGGSTIDVSGGGGGAFEENPASTGAGMKGFSAAGGDPTGGNGGTTFPDPGGYGFGGGGAAEDGGGGGGGYSGGGGGFSARGGGGGGSFTNDNFAFSVNQIVTGSSVGDNGRIDYAITGQIHDQRADALPILPEGTESDLIFTLSGTTIAATVSPLNNVPEPGPDVWYTHTNTSECEQFLRLDWPVSQNTQVVNILGSGTPVQRTAGPLNISLDPGETREFRISSQSETFAIEVDFAQVGDSDNDGVCNTVDICPGVDDLTLDPADDVDEDGIHDVCDQACETDIFPDGEFTFEDWQVLITVVLLGSPQNILQLDFDQSGRFDSFDYAIFFNHCP